MITEELDKFVCAVRDRAGFGVMDWMQDFLDELWLPEPLGLVVDVLAQMFVIVVVVTPVNIGWLVVGAVRWVAGLFGGGDDDRF